MTVYRDMGDRGEIHGEKYMGDRGEIHGWRGLLANEIQGTKGVDGWAGLRKVSQKWGALRREGWLGGAPTPS